MPRSLILLAFISILALASITHNASTQKPELIVQTGHQQSINSITFSPDGSLLASGGEDKTIKIWDVSTGTQLRSLEGHTYQVSSVRFSPNSKILASGSADNTVRLWDVLTGTQLHSLNGTASTDKSIAFSPDGKVLASGSPENAVKLWDVSTGALLRSLEGHTGSLYSVAFSPKGNILATSSQGDSTIKLWDAKTGNLLRSFVEHTSMVTTLAFSPNGKILVSGSHDKTIKLWDISTGDPLRSLEGRATLELVTFSADGKQLVTVDLSKEIKIWDVSTGTLLRSLITHNPASPIALSPDGKTAAGGGHDYIIGLWDVTTDRQLASLGGHISMSVSVAFSPDGKTLAIGGRKSTLWDISTGIQQDFLEGNNSTVSSITFSPDGTLLAVGCFDGTIKLWNVLTGTLLRSIKGHSWVVWAVAFSPDGDMLATGSQAENTVKLWDVKTGNLLRPLNGHTGWLYSVDFSPKEKILASGSLDGTIKLWDASTGILLRSLEGHAGMVYSVKFSPDGRTLASGGFDYSRQLWNVPVSATIKLWDVKTGNPLRSLVGHTRPITSVAFSPDGRLLISNSYDKTIRLWDTSTGFNLQTFKENYHGGGQAIFGKDSKYLVSTNEDANIKLWESSSGKELASLILVNESDWIVITPDGLFDGFTAALNKIIWRFNNNTFDYAPVEAFFSDFYYPELLTDIFEGKRPKAPSDISQKDRRQPQLKLILTDAQLNASIGSRNAMVKVEVSHAPTGAKDVRLFRNGSLVKVWHGDVLNGKANVTLGAAIPIVAGENRLTAYAFNNDNIKSSDATLVINGSDILKRAGTLYIIAIGLNEYSNKDFNLKYAVPDAEAFSAELKRHQERLKNYARTEVIHLYNEQAKKKKILDALANLSKRAQPEDAVVVYFAGHGTVGSCRLNSAQTVNAKDRFYLVPFDLGYEGSIPDQCNQSMLDIIKRNSISDEELENRFEGIDAGQILLVIDACNSGQALESEEKRRGPMNSKGLAQLAYEKGMYILTAAQSFQDAKADKKIAKGHGYLTYALVEEGLKMMAADKEPKDGQLLLREWLNYAVQRVPLMQQAEAKERRQFVKRPGEKVAEEDVQQPRVFYRREIDTKPFVIAR